MSGQPVKVQSALGQTVICDGKFLTIRSGRKGRHETKVPVSDITSTHISRTLTGGYVQFRANGESLEVHFRRGQRADFERFMLIVEAAMTGS
jgi:hypothetical protein